MERENSTLAKAERRLSVLGEFDKNFKFPKIS